MLLRSFWDRSRAVVAHGLQSIASSFCLYLVIHVWALLLKLADMKFLLCLEKEEQWGVKSMVKAVQLLFHSWQKDKFLSALNGHLFTRIFIQYTTFIAAVA